MNPAALHGFSHSGDRTTFVFSPLLYGIAPVHRVAVTGDFRDWSLEHEHGRWQLQPDPTDGLWKLTVWNPGFSRVPLSAQFKFLVNDGGWINPLRAVPNQFLNNFVFFGAHPLPKLVAELVHESCISLHFTSLERVLIPAAYTLMTHTGETIAIAAVLPAETDSVLLFPEQKIDIKRVHYLIVRWENEMRAVFCRFDGWWRTLYSPLPLGATVAGGQTTFRVFAPRAEGLKLYLYADHLPEQAPFATYSLTEEPAGTWAISLPGNLAGTWYDFTVHGPDEPGAFYHEQVPVHISDPYARANAECWGRSLVVERTDDRRQTTEGSVQALGRASQQTERAQPLPVTLSSDEWSVGEGRQQGMDGEQLPPPAAIAPRPAIQDVVAYEVHIEDFTLGLPVPEAEKGTFAAFTRKGLKNKAGAPVGLDHLRELGVNVVHLLPVQEFLHYPEKEWRNTFGQDEFMVEQGVNEAYYEWGYRTSHAFALENRYRTAGDSFGAERVRFQELVAALHAVGMAVIVDIVPNHTAENMDGKPGKGGYVLHWNALDSLYHYRWLAPELTLAPDVALREIPAQMAAAFVMYGEYGNEVKFENRPMVQRWLVDQCRMLMDEFGVDGFRIDLAGQVDKQTLHQLREALGPGAILYGEPWIASYDPEFEANPAWDWYKFDAPLTWFNDGARNAFKGGTGTPQDPLRDRGYAGGNAAERDNVISGLTKGFPEDYTPTSSINYLDIHDNWALADQFAMQHWDGRLGVDENRVKIAATLLLTSPGPVVLHGGTELLRSKGLAELKETIKYLPHPQFPDQGPVEVHFHGKRDTYNMRAANRFVWENAGRTMADGAACDYAGMTAFWRDLIALRRSEAVGHLFSLREHPAEAYHKWFGPEAHTLGYLINNELMVLLNVGTVSETVVTPILLPGSWRLIGNLSGINLAGVADSDPAVLVLSGGAAHTLVMPAAGMRMWRLA